MGDRRWAFFLPEGVFKLVFLSLSGGLVSCNFCKGKIGLILVLRLLVVHCLSGLLLWHPLPLRSIRLVAIISRCLASYWLNGLVIIGLLVSPPFSFLLSPSSPYPSPPFPPFISHVGLRDILVISITMYLLFAYCYCYHLALLPLLPPECFWYMHLATFLVGAWTFVTRCKCYGYGLNRYYECIFCCLVIYFCLLICLYYIFSPLYLLKKRVVPTKHVKELSNCLPTMDTHLVIVNLIYNLLLIMSWCHERLSREVR